MNAILKSILNPIGDFMHFEDEGPLFVGPDYTDRIISFPDINYLSEDIFPQLWSIDMQIIEPAGLDTDVPLDFYIERILGFIERSSIVDLIGYAINEEENCVEILVANDLVITSKTEGDFIDWREKINFPTHEIVGSNNIYF